MKEIPTPRTDAALKHYQGLVRATIATGPLPSISRQLERDRAELIEALATLHDAYGKDSKAKAAALVGARHILERMK